MTLHGFWTRSGTPDFNPHSREGSDAVLPAIPAGTDYFNPHSREGSDKRAGAGVTLGVISIHTPAKGVTKIKKLSKIGSFISIHTPAKGVIHRCLHKRTFDDFNPHSREGSDTL